MKKYVLMQGIENNFDEALNFDEHLIPLHAKNAKIVFFMLLHFSSDYLQEYCNANQMSCTYMYEPSWGM